MTFEFWYWFLIQVCYINFYIDVAMVFATGVLFRVFGQLR